jgi:hypothetical protein
VLVSGRRDLDSAIGLGIGFWFVSEFGLGCWFRVVGIGVRLMVELNDRVRATIARAICR